MTDVIHNADKQLKLNLGGIVLSVVTSGRLDLTVPSTHKAFLVSEGEPDIALRAEFGAIPPLELEEELFRTRGVWRLYRSGDKRVLHFCDWEVTTKPQKVAIMEPDFHAGTIYSRIRGSEQKNQFIPLYYPLDEILVVNFLSKGNGMLVHACAVEYRGQGWLFLGTSGAGKSTLSNLWKEEPGVTLLSDDRIIIRETKDGYRIYGTPWHGNAEISSPVGAPLSRIFFLVHDHENSLTPVQGADVASRLLVRSFPTFWDSEGMRYTLDLCEGLSIRVPCYELGFVPDKRVISMLKNLT